MPISRRRIVLTALLLVVLSGIGPIIAWRRVTVQKLRRSFAFPITVAAWWWVSMPRHAAACDSRAGERNMCGDAGSRKWVMVAFGLSIAFTAVSFFLNFLGFSGGVAF